MPLSSTHPALANPTPRQRVDSSSPFYYQALTRHSRIPHRGSAWILQVLSTIMHSPGTRESHTAAACGFFKSFLLTSTHPALANPTPRQRVVPSSPFLLIRSQPLHDQRCREFTTRACIRRRIPQLSHAVPN